MNRSTILAAVAVALIGSAPVAAGVFKLTVANPVNPIPSNNDFQANLNAEGLFFYTSTGASLSLSGATRLKFEFLGSESGFFDSFRVGSTTLFSENVSGLIDNWASPIDLGTIAYSSGPINNWFFDSVQGLTNQGIGTKAFGFFIPRGLSAGDVFRSRVLYIGFDDQPQNPDDNHDDLIIRITAAIPEPATWAMMIAGFGLVGFAARRRRDGPAAQNS